VAFGRGGAAGSRGRGDRRATRPQACAVEHHRLLRAADRRVMRTRSSPSWISSSACRSLDEIDEGLELAQVHATAFVAGARG
jgi:hypothetical protein